jgi:hypothetical protein
VGTLGEEPLTKTSRALPYARTWNIAFRTAHIGAAGVTFGGHVFGMGAERILPWLYLTILTGTLLVIVEAYPSWRWCYQMRGVMVLTKAMLLLLVLWLWNYRVPILVGVIVIGSAGSHMPKRFRHYLLVGRRLVP